MGARVARRVGDGARSASPTSSSVTMAGSRPRRSGSTQARRSASTTISARSSPTTSPTPARRSHVNRERPPPCVARRDLRDLSRASHLLPATSLFTVLGDLAALRVATTWTWHAAPRLDVSADVGVRRSDGDAIDGATPNIPLGEVGEVVAPEFVLTPRFGSTIPVPARWAVSCDATVRETLAGQAPRHGSHRAPGCRRRVDRARSSFRSRSRIRSRVAVGARRAV